MTRLSPISPPHLIFWYCSSKCLLPTECSLSRNYAFEYGLEVVMFEPYDVATAPAEFFLNTMDRVRALGAEARRRILHS